MPPAPLHPADLKIVIRAAPLVAIDLIIRNGRNEMLLGLRNNEPARGSFFVPEGSIRKNERLRKAFARILQAETGFTAKLDAACLARHL